MMNHRACSFAPCGAALLVALLLGGCGESDVKEVKQWMAQTKAQTKVVVSPLSEPKTFIPFAYDAKEAVDPFNPAKLATELKGTKSSNQNRPDPDRRKELLESYPLDTMVMVGTIQKGGIIYALVQIDKALHQVKTGQHLGQNFGLVTGITESAVTVREIVQDASGEWTERVSKLELQESKETKK